MCKCVIIAGETVIRCAAHAPREIGIKINLDPNYTAKLKQLADDFKKAGFISGGVAGYPVMRNNTAKSSGSFRYVHHVNPDKDADMTKQVQDAISKSDPLDSGEIVITKSNPDPLSNGDFDFKIDAAMRRSLNFLVQAQEAERSMAIYRAYWDNFPK